MNVSREYRMSLKQKFRFNRSYSLLIYALYWCIWTANVSFHTQDVHPSTTDSTTNSIRNVPTVQSIFCLAAEAVEEKESNSPLAAHTGIMSSTKMKPVAVNIIPESISRNERAIPLIASERKPIPKETLSLNQILYRAGKRGLGGGIPGAIAGAIQVLSLMWLRTIINYQCRYGTTFIQALRTLLHDGGIARLYCGVSFALIQAPLARFVSTAANDGVESLLANLSFTKHWGPGRTTVVASIVVGLWRMLLMPIDTAKTVLQIDSVEGFRSLMRRVKAGRIGLLYSGAIANAVAAILGHYPWFFTYNVLSASNLLQILIPSQLLRNAGIGVVSSVVSDTVVNVFRVIKTTKQSLGSKHSASYIETIRIILAADGYKGLFGRGLRTRIYANALQSVVFTIVWRGLVDYWKRKTSKDERLDQ